MTSHRAAKTLQVSAKAGCVLDMANRDKARARVYQTNQLIEIDATTPLFTDPDLDT